MHNRGWNRKVKLYFIIALSRDKLLSKQVYTVAINTSFSSSYQL